MRGSRARRLLAIVLLVVFSPSIVLAQPPRAGVVTTVQGEATFTRAAVPRPIRVNFRDDVFLRDRIDTKEQAVVRVLLGGKAVITVRELSVVTITETPSVSVVNLQVGRVALGVAKSELRRGERIEVRTPNAVAAVRGSLLIAEVRLVAGVPQTSFAALQATTPIAVVSLARPAVTIPLRPNQVVNITGVGPGTQTTSVQALTPAQASALAQAAAAPKPAEQTENSPPRLVRRIVNDKVQEASQLAAALAPSSEAPGRVADPELGGATESITLGVAGAPLVVESLATFETPFTSLSTRPLFELSGEIIAQKGITISADVVISGLLIEPAPDSKVTVLESSVLNVESTGSLTALSPDPLTRLRANRVESLSGSFLRAGGRVKLAGPLIDASDTTIGSVDFSVIDVAGVLESLSERPLLDLRNSPIQTRLGETSEQVGFQRTGFLDVAGGSVTLAGPLLQAVDSPLTATGSLGFISVGSTLRSGTSLPLITLVDSPVKASSGSFLDVLTGGRVSLSGPLLMATTSEDESDPDRRTGIRAAGPFGFISVGRPSPLEGPRLPAELRSTSQDPLIVLDETPVTSPAGSFLEVLSGSMVELAGPLLLSLGSAITSSGDFGFITVDGVLRSASADPLIALTGKVVGEELRRSTVSASPGSFLAVEFGSVELRGPLVSALNSDIAFKDFAFVRVAGTLTTSSPDPAAVVEPGPLVILDHSTIRPLPTEGTPLFGAGGFLDVPGGSVQLAGPVLAAMDSIIDAPGNFGFISVAFGSISSTSTQPLITLQNTPVTASPGTFLDVFSASVNLAGPLVVATESPIHVEGFVSVAGFGALLTSTSLAPLISLDHSDVVGTDKIAFAQGFLEIFDGTVDLNGPLLHATASKIIATGDFGSGFISLSRGSLTSKSKAPLITLADHSEVTTPGAFLQIRSFSGRNASVSLAGPLLAATDSPITVQGFVSVSGSFSGSGTATLASTSPDPLIRLDHSDVQAAGAAGSFSPGFLEVFSGGRVALAGPLLMATASKITAAGEFGIGFISLFEGSLTSMGQTPLITLRENSAVTATPGRFLDVFAADVKLSGPLVMATDSQIMVEGFVRLSGSFSSGRPATLTSTSSEPLVTLVGSDVQGAARAPDQFTFAPGFVEVFRGTIDLGGPLLSATGSAIITTGDFGFGFLSLRDASLMSRTSTPLITLDKSPVTAPSSRFLDLSGFQNTAQVDLVGPLLAATDSQITVRGFVSVFSGCFFPPLCGQASLVSQSDRPLITLARSAVTAGTAKFLDVSSGSVELAGPLLQATASTITAPGFISVRAGSLRSTSDAPLVQLTATPVVQTSGDLGPLVFAEFFAVNSGRVSLQGPLLAATDSNIRTFGDTIRIVNASTFASATTEPLLSITGGVVTADVVGAFLRLSTGSLMTLEGSFLKASGTTLTNAETGFPFSFISVSGSASLVSRGPSSLLALDATDVTTSGNVLFLGASSSATKPSAVVLAGPLISAGNGSSFVNGDPTRDALSFVFVGDSATLTTARDTPLLVFDGSTLDTTGDVLTVRRSLSPEAPTTVALSGPLFVASKSTVNTTSLGHPAKIACCPGFFLSQAAELVGLGAEPLIQLTESTFNAGPDEQSGGSFFSISDTSPSGGLVAPARLRLAGPFLRAEASKVTALFDLLAVTRSSVTATGGEPLIQLQGSTVELGGLNPFTSRMTLARILRLTSASLTLAGPLLSAVDSRLTTTANVIAVFDGATLTSGTTEALVDLRNTSLATPRFIRVSGTGRLGAPAIVTLHGPLLSVSDGSALTLDLGLLGLFDGGQLATASSTESVSTNRPLR